MYVVGLGVLIPAILRRLALAIKRGKVLGKNLWGKRRNRKCIVATKPEKPVFH